MPRLLYFFACQKAIIDREDTNLSAIGILHGLEATYTSTDNADASKPGRIPGSWAVISGWLRMPGDEDKIYEQHVSILSPEQEELAYIDTVFAMMERNHSNSGNANVFPVTCSGEYDLVLSLREVGDDKQWEEIARYPIEILITQLPEPEQ